MRVAIFTDTYPPYVNGVSTSCFNLANALKARGDSKICLDVYYFWIEFLNDFDWFRRKHISDTEAIIAS